MKALDTNILVRLRTGDDTAALERIEVMHAYRRVGEKMRVLGGYSKIFCTRSRFRLASAMWGSAFRASSK